jgi:hypothetical protein
VDSMVTVPAVDCVATGVEGSAVSHKENRLLVLVTSGHIKGTAILALTVVGEVADDMILVVGASVEISDNQNSGQAMESSGNVLHSPESWG